MAFLRYLFSFKGRINRAKMWGFLLIAAVLQATLMTLKGVSGGRISTTGWDITLDDDAPRSVVAIAAIVSLLVVWSFIAVAVKRLHDRDFRGWWLLVFFVVPILPVVTIALALQSIGVDLNKTVPTLILIAGFVVAALFQAWGFLELYVAPGTRGPNRFGPDPLAPPD